MTALKNELVRSWGESLSLTSSSSTASESPGRKFEEFEAALPRRPLRRL